MCLYKAGEGKMKEIYYLTGLVGNWRHRDACYCCRNMKKLHIIRLPTSQKYNSTNISVTGNNSIFSASKKSRKLAFLKMKAEIRFVI